MRWFLLVGRLLFGGVVLFSAAQHVIHGSAMSAAAAAHGVPYPEIAVSAGALLLGLAGISLVLGLLPRVGLALVALYLVPVTGVMHAFWAAPDAVAHDLGLAMFLKNVALLGATAAMCAIPAPWPWSVDSWRSNIDGGLMSHRLSAWFAQVMAALRGSVGAAQHSLRKAMRRGLGQAKGSALARAYERDTSGSVASGSPWLRGPDAGASYYVRRSFIASRDGGVLLRRSYAYWTTLHE